MQLLSVSHMRYCFEPRTYTSWLPNARRRVVGVYRPASRTAASPSPQRTPHRRGLLSLASGERPHGTTRLRHALNGNGRERPGTISTSIDARLLVGGHFRAPPGTPGIPRRDKRGSSVRIRQGAPRRTTAPLLGTTPVAARFCFALVSLNPSRTPPRVVEGHPDRAAR
jgi:hypothetical protein